MGWVATANYQNFFIDQDVAVIHTTMWFVKCPLKLEHLVVIWVMVYEWDVVVEPQHMEVRELLISCWCLVDNSSLAHCSKVLFEKNVWLSSRHLKVNSRSSTLIVTFYQEDHIASCNNTNVVVHIRYVCSSSRIDWSKACSLFLSSFKKK